MKVEYMNETTLLAIIASIGGAMIASSIILLRLERRSTPRRRKRKKKKVQSIVSKTVQKQTKANPVVKRMSGMLLLATIIAIAVWFGGWEIYSSLSIWKFMVNTHYQWLLILVDATIILCVIARGFKSHSIKTVESKSLDELKISPSFNAQYPDIANLVKISQELRRFKIENKTNV